MSEANQMDYDDAKYDRVGGGYLRKSEASSTPVFYLTDIQFSGDGVYVDGKFVDVPVGQPFNISAKTNLPNGSLTMIAERVINGSQVMGDSRLKVQVIDGVAKCGGKFNLSGNYLLRQERQNAGLQARQKPFSVEFSAIDIDAYEMVTT